MFAVHSRFPYPVLLCGLSAWSRLLAFYLQRKLFVMKSIEILKPIKNSFCWRLSRWMSRRVEIGALLRGCKSLPLFSALTFQNGSFCKPKFDCLSMLHFHITQGICPSVLRVTGTLMDWLCFGNCVCVSSAFSCHDGPWMNCRWKV